MRKSEHYSCGLSIALLDPVFDFSFKRSLMSVSLVDISHAENIVPRLHTTIITIAVANSSSHCDVDRFNE